MEFCFSFFSKNEGINFPGNENPSILNFNGINGGSGYHTGYKMLDTFENLTTTDTKEKNSVDDYRFDLSPWRQLIFFIYVNIIEYQYVVNTKAPLIPVIGSKQWLKDVSLCEIEPTLKIVFSNLESKSLIKKLQTMQVKLLF